MQFRLVNEFTPIQPFPKQGKAKSRAVWGGI